MTGFSVRQALGQALARVRARFGAMVGLTLLYYVVLMGITVIFAGSLFAGGAPGTDPRQMLAGMGAGILVLYVGIYALAFFHQAALCRLFAADRPAALGDAIRAGARSILPLFGAGILLFIGVIILSLLSTMLAALLGRAGAVVTLGMLAVFLVFGARLALILPVISNDDVNNPIEAIRRSWSMTHGNAAKLIAMFLIVGLIITALFVALFMVTIGIPSPGVQPGAGGLAALFVGFALLGITVLGYFVALVAAAHDQLSGPDLQRVEDTFA